MIEKLSMVSYDLIRNNEMKNLILRCVKSFFFIIICITSFPIFIMKAKLFKFCVEYVGNVINLEWKRCRQPWHGRQ